MSARVAPALVAVVCAGAALAPAWARAEECPPEAADVSWARLEGAEAQCPAAHQIRAELERRLGRKLVPTGDGISIEAVVQGQPGGWSAQIRTERCDGTPATVRKLDDRGTSCDGIVEAALLHIGLAIDPDAYLSAASSVAPSAAPSVTPSAAPPLPAPPRPPPPSWRAAEPPFPWPAVDKTPPPPVEPPPAGISVVWRGFAAAGVLPSVGGGAALSGGWSVVPRLTLETGAMWFAEQNAADPMFAFGLTAGWLGACAEVIRSRSVALGLCGRAVAGAIHAVIYENKNSVGDDSNDILPTNPGARPWLSLGVGARLGVHVVGPLRIETGIDMFVPMTRYSFELEEGSPTDFRFQQAAVAGAIFVGAGVTF